MNEEDRRYLRSVNKRRPSLEVFTRMVWILTSAHKRIDQLLSSVNKFLLETYKPN